MPSFPMLDARQSALALPWPALVEEIVRLLRDDSVTVPPRLVDVFGQSVRHWLTHQLSYCMARQRECRVSVGDLPVAIGV